MGSFLFLLDVRGRNARPCISHPALIGPVPKRTPRETVPGPRLNLRRHTARLMDVQFKNSKNANTKAQKRMECGGAVFGQILRGFAETACPL